MKIVAVLFMFSILALAGCANLSTDGEGVKVSYPGQDGTPNIQEIGHMEPTEPEPLIFPSPDAMQPQPFPDEINLFFQPLDISELSEGPPGPDWQKTQSIAFGMTGLDEVKLHLYNEAVDSSDISPLHALLQVNDKGYPIRNLLPDADQKQLDRCSGLCIIQKSMTDLEQRVFLGAIPMMASGSGLYTYIFYDEDDERRLFSFEAWGKLQWVDMDLDGTEEMLLVFEGLGNNPMDLYVLRNYDGNMELSESVLKSLHATNGYEAVLETSAAETLIRIYDRAAESVSAKYRLEEGNRWVRREKAVEIDKNR